MRGWRKEGLIVMYTGHEYVVGLVCMSVSGKGKLVTGMIGIWGRRTSGMRGKPAKTAKRPLVTFRIALLPVAQIMQLLGSISPIISIYLLA